MIKQQIKQLIENSINEDGLVETGIKGVQLFRVSQPHACAPAVYEPSVVAIVNGSKEAILDGKHYVYDSHQYLCCTMSLPVEAGTPNASIDEPLLGVMISLETKAMTGLAIEMDNTVGTRLKSKASAQPQGLALACWDDAFAHSLLRLLQLSQSKEEIAILGEGRLREFYYSVLKGEVGNNARHAFGVGNEIARAIDYLSAYLDESVTIENMADQVGMSRAVFHRKFKQATTMSPIQFIKSMRLNSAAMKIASGVSVNVAALGVGYTSSSQFSREFKRLYGQSPKRWSHENLIAK